MTFLCRALTAFHPASGQQRLYISGSKLLILARPEHRSRNHIEDRNTSKLEIKAAFKTDSNHANMYWSPLFTGYLVSFANAAAIGPVKQSVDPNASNAIDMAARSPNDIILSFNTFTAPSCGNDNFYKTHNPKTAGICHQFDASEKGFDVYAQTGTCRRK